MHTFWIVPSIYYISTIGSQLTPSSTYKKIGLGIYLLKEQFEEYGWDNYTDARASSSVRAKEECCKSHYHFGYQITDCSNCYVLTFWRDQKCHSRLCTGRKWYILMAVMRGNCMGGNWRLKWDEVKISHDTLIDWRTGREWPLNCMTVISAWWRLNIRFQRSSGRSSRHWTII